jgi:hypothetical protein
MIRNVVMGKLREPADEAQAAADRAQLDTALAGIRALDLPGQIAMELGPDVGLRDGGWDFAITNVWADADSYRNYDTDPEHNVHRAKIDEIAAQLARVQFEL